MTAVLEPSGSSCVCALEQLRGTTILQMACQAGLMSAWPAGAPGCAPYQQRTVLPPAWMLTEPQENCTS